MKLNRDKGGSQSIFSDMLFSVLIVFVLAFYLIFILINPKAIPDVNVKKEANWVMELSWPKNIDCDVDMWVKDPQDRVVWFRNRDIGVMGIERDDQGVKADTTLNGRGDIITVDENLEIWTLRGKLDGEYTVNAHLYNCLGMKSNGEAIGASKIIPVELKIVRINPRYKVMHTSKATLKKVWQEVTLAKFKLFNDNRSFQYLGNDFVEVVRLSQGKTLR
jgi:hypothetical protein